MYRPGASAASGGDALEHVLQQMMMVAIETEHGRGAALTLELASDETELTAVSGFQSQTAIGPELSLGAETVRGLDEDDQQHGADGADVTNLAEQGKSGMLAALA